MILSSNNFQDVDTVSRLVWNKWIPAQRSVANLISSKILSGAYGDSVSLLIDDLKKDISIYLFTVRALTDRSRLAKEQSKFPGSINSQEKSVGSSFLPIISLLDEIKEKYCDTRLDSPSQYQIELIKESIVGSNLVESLSSSFNLEKGVSYTVSSLRSLGKLLIAWNYPKEFEEALSIFSNSPYDTTIDTILTNSFGFAPSTLGAKVALRMGFNDGIANLISKVNIPTSSSFTANSIHSRLNCICNFGETFASLNSALPHAISSKESTELINFLKKNLGDTGLAALYLKTNEACQEYSKQFPSIFPKIEFDLEDSDPKKISDKIEITRLARRAGIKDLDFISNLVVDIKNPDNGPRLLKKFLYETLEERGITEMVLYTISPIEKTLLPVFKKGNPSFVKAQECPIYSDSTINILVRDAYLEKHSEVIRGALISKESITAFVSPIPHRNPFGVIYIEGKSEDLSSDKIKAIGELIIAIMYKVYVSPDKR